MMDPYTIPLIQKLTKEFFADFQKPRLFPKAGLWDLALELRDDPPKPVKGINLNFSGEFLVPKLFNGTKTMTIRPLFKKVKKNTYEQYKSRYTITEGTEVHLFYHLRQHDCEFVGDGDSLGLPPVLSFNMFSEALALCDGFRRIKTSAGSYTALEVMQTWFRDRYGSDWAQKQPYIMIAWDPKWNTIEEPFGQTFNPRKGTLDGWLKGSDFDREVC